MEALYVPPGGSCGKSTPRLVKKLLADGATSEWSARALEPTRKIEQRALERSLKSGLIRSTAEGKYWVDEERYSAWRTTQIRWAVISVLATFLLLAILYVLGELP